MQPSRFNGAETEDIFSWLNKFELIATNNKSAVEQRGRSIPLHQDKSALIYYNSLSEQAKANQQLIK